MPALWVAGHTHRHKHSAIHTMLRMHDIPCVHRLYIWTLNSVAYDRIELGGPTTARQIKLVKVIWLSSKVGQWSVRVRPASTLLPRKADALTNIHCGSLIKHSSSSAHHDDPAPNPSLHRCGLNRLNLRCGPGGVHFPLDPDQSLPAIGREDGVSLFSRHAKGMSLTHQRHLILDTVDSAKRSQQQNTDQVAGRLAFGVPSVLAGITWLT